MVHYVKHPGKNVYKHIIKSVWGRYLLCLHSVPWMEGDEIIFINLDESIPYTYANMCAWYICTIRTYMHTNTQYQYMDTAYTIKHIIFKYSLKRHLSSLTEYVCLVFLKIRWRNLPNQVRIWASLHDNKYTNFSCVDNIENVGLLLDTLLSRNTSLLYIKDIPLRSVSRPLLFYS